MEFNSHHQFCLIFQNQHHFLQLRQTTCLILSLDQGLASLHNSMEDAWLITIWWPILILFLIFNFFCIVLPSWLAITDSILSHILESNGYSEKSIMVFSIAHKILFCVIGSVKQLLHNRTQFCQFYIPRLNGTYINISTSYSLTSASSINISFSLSLAPTSYLP